MAHNDTCLYDHTTHTCDMSLLYAATSLLEREVVGMNVIKFPEQLKLTGLHKIIMCNSDLIVAIFYHKV